MQNARGGIASLSGPELEYFVLARLERFASRLADARIQEVRAWDQLARHATAVAYWDCVALGLRDEALVILDEAGLRADGDGVGRRLV
jgi:hypothetical protein